MRLILPAAAVDEAAAPGHSGHRDDADGIVACLNLGASMPRP